MGWGYLGIICAVCAVCCAIGFRKFVWFLSIGYGFAIIGGAIVIVLIYALVTKRGERKDHWAEREARDAGKNHIWEAVVLTVIMAAILAGGIYVGKWFNDHAEEIQQHIEMQEAVILVALPMIRTRSSFRLFPRDLISSSGRIRMFSFHLSRNIISMPRMMKGPPRARLL